MNIHRWKWRIAVAVPVLLVIAALATFAVRNTLSTATIVGQWRGYALQQYGSGGRTAAAKVPLALSFRPDGTVIRGHNMTQAKYQVADNALVFYDIQSLNAPKHPILWNARLVNDTLTLSGETGPAAVLRRVL